MFLSEMTGKTPIDFRVQQIQARQNPENENHFPCFVSNVTCMNLIVAVAKIPKE